MDEILASIRRIITEEDPPLDTHSGAVGQAPNETQANHGDPLVTESNPDESDVERAPVAEAPLAPVEAAAPEETLVSTSTSAAAASSFDRLSTVVRQSERDASLLMPAAGRSLEDVVRELLRPMLKDWLEEQLPRIVREQVDEEVARIARGRVR